MTTFEDFQNSLPKDLNSDQRAEKLQEFAQKRDEEFRTLQSSTAKGVENLKAQQEELLTEAKKVGENEDYILELHEKNPEMANTILKTFGNWATIEDVKAWKWSWVQTKVDVQKEIELYKKREAAGEAVDKFKRSLGFTAEEEVEFVKKVEVLKWGRDLSATELRPILAWVAMEMWRKVSTNRDEIIAEHNVNRVWWSSGWKGWSDYTPNDSAATELLYAQWVLSRPPSK